MIKTKTILLLLAVSMISLACSIFIGGPEYPDEIIPISSEAVDSLETQIQEALQAGAENGLVTLEITEEQLTSFVSAKVAAQEPPFFYDPQIYLRDEQMRIFGKVERGTLVANILITLKVSVDEEGKPKLEISSVDFGPFPAPDGFNQSLTALVTEAYTGSLGPVASGFRIEAIQIADGIMTITGRIK